MANGKLLKENIFDDIWVQPASGDSGGAIGAALSVYYSAMNQKRLVLPGMDGMSGAYLGPSYDQNSVESYIRSTGAAYKVLSDKELFDVVAKELANGKVIGWYQGRMEFGPRALGSRSIIADPRGSDMQRHLNLKIKYRESFRPFAPSVLYRDAMEWFDIDRDSPYMLFVVNVAKKRQLKMHDKYKDIVGVERVKVPMSDIPAVTHVNYSARVQTVRPESNLRYYNLISRFKDLTGCPVLINTSFNVRGEPIVNTPNDAYNCFLKTGIDVLVMENTIIFKGDQN